MAVGADEPEIQEDRVSCPVFTPTHLSLPLPFFTLSAVARIDFPITDIEANIRHFVKSVKDGSAVTGSDNAVVKKGKIVFVLYNDFGETSRLIDIFSLLWFLDCRIIDFES